VIQPPPPGDPINIARVWASKFPNAVEMYDCLTELGDWCATFQSAKDSIGEDLFSSFPIAREWGSWDQSVTSLIHRILSVQKEVDFLHEVSVLHEACRLGSWLYLAEIRHRFYIRPLDYAVQKTKLLTLLTKHDKEWGGLEMLHFWVLVVALLQSTPGSERTWFVEEVRKLAGKLGINSYVEAEVQLRELLWMSDVHGRKLSELKGDIWP
jgi:hypothetical protein